MNPILIIVVMLVLGFPVIIAVGGIGAAAGIVGSAVSNKKSYDEISRSDPALAELEKEGSVAIDNGSVRLTTYGLDRTNLVMERLLEG